MPSSIRTKAPKIEKAEIFLVSEDENASIQVDAGPSVSQAPPQLGKFSKSSNTPIENPFAGLPTAVVAVPSSPDWPLDSFQDLSNFISNITPDPTRYIWRSANKFNSFYTLYNKYNDVMIRPQKILIPGCLGEYVDLDQPSRFDRWQVKLSVNNTISQCISALLLLGPFTPGPTKELTISLKTKDPALQVCDVDPNGPFPFLYDGTSTCTDYTDHELRPEDFTEGTEVVVECLFTAYSMKNRSGYSWKLLAVIKASTSDEATPHNLIVDTSPLLSPKRKAPSSDFIPKKRME